jgi:hypothetical protein
VNPPRVISGRDTAFAKLVIPASVLAAIGYIGWAAVRYLGSPEGRAGGGLQLGLLVGLVAITIPALPLAWMCLRMKRVTLGQTTLRVSNHLREIEVPLREVERVDQILGNASRVVVRFTHNTTFGRAIHFSPIGLTPPTPHPIVAELRAAVAEAKAT